VVTTTTRLLVAVIIFKLILVIWGLLHAAGPVWSMWDQWDSNVYRTIATQGYTPEGIAPDYFSFLSHFPPLYPVAMFLVAQFFRITPQIAGILISWAAIVLASYFLYRLVHEETGDETWALNSVLFMTIWPTSYFTIAVYAEPLFLLFLILSFYALRKESFTWAGLAGGAAILTRLPGIMIVPAYGIILWRLYQKKDRRVWKAGLALLAIPALAVGIHLGINFTQYGDPLHFEKEYRENPYSSKHLITPFSETVQDATTLVRGIPHTLGYDFMMLHGWNVIFTILATIIALIGIRILPAEYSAFSLASILLFASMSWGISNARFTLPIFPLFIVLGRMKPNLRTPTIALSLCLLLYFTSIFVTGAWTF
jgi:Gpi18-like mannosyltransferase